MSTKLSTRTLTPKPLHSRRLLTPKLRLLPLLLLTLSPLLHLQQQSQPLLPTPNRSQRPHLQPSRKR